MNISCYKTQAEDLPKTFCKIVEKCYYTNMHSCVLVSNEDLIDGLDRVVWTYSKKHFIPHATHKDPMPQQQPVYITNKPENPNNSEIFIFINPDAQQLAEALSAKNFISNTDSKKIIIIHDQLQKTNSSEITNIMQKSNFKDAPISCFEKDQSGSWQQA